MRKYLILTLALAGIVAGTVALASIPAPTLKCYAATVTLQGCKDCAADEAVDNCPAGPAGAACRSSVFSAEYGFCKAIYCPPSNYLCVPIPPDPPQ